MYVTLSTLGPAETPVVESYSGEATLAKEGSKVGTMADVRVQAMKHKDDADGLPLGKVSVGLQFDFVLALIHLEVDETVLLELVNALGVGLPELL